MAIASAAYALSPFPLKYKIVYWIRRSKKETKVIISALSKIFINLLSVVSVLPSLGL